MTDFDLIDKTTPDNDDDPNFRPNKSPLLFLIALEAMRRTFAKAGSYRVKDSDTSRPVLNVDRIPIEEHLVMARKFVLEWMNRRSPPQERAVIRQLARIDLHIRRRWWRNGVDNPTWTFTKAIQAAEPLADNQWSFDYATNLYHGSAPWHQEDYAEDSGDYGESAPWHQEDDAEDYSLENTAADSGDWD